MNNNNCWSKNDIQELLSGYSAYIRSIFLSSAQPQRRGLIRRNRLRVNATSKFPGELQRACAVLGYDVEVWNDLYVIKVP